MSGIEWTEKTWNPTTGCTRVSAGCDNCYAVAMSKRLAGRGDPKYTGTVNPGKGHFNGAVKTHAEALDVPLRRKKPTVWFVNSMSDLFHPNVPDDFIDKVFAVMALTPQHTYQILTKRPSRAAEYLCSMAEYWPHQIEDAGGDMFAQKWGELEAADCREQGVAMGQARETPRLDKAMDGFYEQCRNLSWPLPNVWLGTSVENQQAADERIPHLLRCPAAVRFLSCEPLLSPVNLVGSQDEYQRASNTGDGGDRNALGGRSRPGLETPGSHSGQQDRGSRSAVSAEAGRYGPSIQGRVSAGSSDDRENPLHSTSASDRLDGSQPADDPGGDGNQSQGRSEGQQPAVQSGGGRAVGERPSFPASDECLSEPEGRKAHTGEGSGNSPPLRHQGHAEGSDCGTVRGERRDSPQRSQALEVGLGSGLIHWVIAGGESGPGARHCDIKALRRIVQQCKAAGVPVFVKQLGSLPLAMGRGAESDWDFWIEKGIEPRAPIDNWEPKLRSTKGGDPSEWPPDLRVREMPHTTEPTQ